jgi:hypothetical protein
VKHTKEEIINALKVIKEECESQGIDCNACPFCVNEGCEIVTRTPNNWELNATEPETWRALK